jgi:hypothetical protein
MHGCVRAADGDDSLLPMAAHARGSLTPATAATLLYTITTMPLPLLLLLVLSTSMPWYVVRQDWWWSFHDCC